MQARRVWPLLSGIGVSSLRAPVAVMVSARDKYFVPWRHAWLAVWLSAVSAPAGAHAFDPFAEEKQGQLQLVVEQLRRGNAHEALLQTNNALAKFPKHGPFYTLRAQILLKLGQPDAALAAVEQAIVLTPDYALSYWIRGLTRMHQDNPAAAIEDFNQVLKLEDQNQTLMAQAIGSRGMALTDLGRHREALEDLNRALEIRPAAFAERQFRAVACLALDHLDVAESDIAALLSHEPDSGLLYRLQGELWLKRRDSKRALASLDRALALNPGDARAYRLRADAHRVLGQIMSYRSDRGRACGLGDTLSCEK